MSSNHSISFPEPHHTTAGAHHYDLEADLYDAFNEATSDSLNSFLSHLLKQHRVKTVLDLTCGTGAQVFYLAQ